VTIPNTGVSTRMLPSAKYPFMISLEKAAELELDYLGPIEVLLEEDEAVARARERLETILREGRAPQSQGETTWDNIIAFHAALAAAAKSGSLRLLYTVVEAEVGRVQKFLTPGERGEFEWGEFNWLAKRLGIQVLKEAREIPWLVGKRSRGKVVYKYLIAAVPVDVYLDVVKHARGGEWRLTNSFLLDGLVYLDYILASEFILQYVRKIILQLAEKYQELELPRLEALGQEYASKLDYALEPGFDEASIPACIAEVLGRLRRGEAGPLDLYVAATFLANVGAPPEVLAQALYQGGYASVPVARLAAEVLMEEARRYTPLRCEVLRGEGVCRECAGEGPLNEYYQRRRQARRPRSR